MITVSDAAKLCATAYIGAANDWDHWLEVEGVAAGIKYLGSDTVIAFRGSQSEDDWLRDFDEIPTDHPLLGHVHSGFLSGMDAFMLACAPMLRGDLYICGHSLGGSHACIMAALSTQRIKRLVLFGCPRPGFVKLRDIVSANCDQIDTFRNRQDPVPLVPYLLGLYHWVKDPQEVYSATAPDFPPEDHSILLYIEATQGM